MSERVLYVIAPMRAGYAHRPAEMLFEMGRFLGESSIECTEPERLSAGAGKHAWKITFESDAGMMAFKMRFQDYLTEWPLKKDEEAEAIRKAALNQAWGQGWGKAPGTVQTTRMKPKTGPSTRNYQPPNVQEILDRMNKRRADWDKMVADAVTKSTPPKVTLKDRIKGLFKK